MLRKNLMKFGMLLVVLLVIAGCSQKASKDAGQKEEKVTPVHVAEVTMGNLQMDREIVGTANPSVDSQIIPKTTGELIKLNVKKGDIVKKGQVIGLIDGNSAQANVSLQQIAVQSAKTQLESAIVQRQLAEQGLKNAQEQLVQAKVNSGTENKNSNTNLNIENAKLQLQLAEKNLERMKQLYEIGGISLKDLEQAQLNEEQARNAYKQAQNSVLTGKSAIAQANIAVENAKNQLETANIQVDASRLQVEQAEVQLSQTNDQLTIKANVAGEIVSLNADVGDVVSSAQPLGTIVSLNPIEIHANVSGEELALFKKGNKIPVYVKALQSTLTATITYASPVADQTGLYLVEGEIQNKDEKIKPGMMLTFKLPTTVVENTLLLPTSALVEEADGTYIYVIENNKAVKKPITVTKSQSDVTAVSGEINAGDQVVTSGQITLSDGNKVKIIEEAAK